MAAFDRTIVCEATPQQVWEAAHGSLITFNVARSTPGRLVLATDDRLGYVCLIAARAGGTAHLRLLIDRVETVQSAIGAAASAQALLAALEATPANPGAANLGQRLLGQIKQAAESAAEATAAPVPAASVTAEEAAPAPARAPVPPQATESAGATTGPGPWNPDTLVRYGFLSLYAISGVLLGINWRRLGKPGWMWPTILPSLAMLLLVVAMIVALVATPSHVLAIPAQSTLLIVLLVGAGIANIFVPLVVADMQRPAYKLWQQTRNRQALLAFEYKARTSILRQGLAFGAIMIVVGVLLYFQTRPRGFEGSGLYLEYPGVWNVYAHEGLDACADDACVVVLVRDTPASVGSTIWVYRYGTSYPDSKALREAAWEYTLDNYYPDAVLIDSEALTVGGYPAAGHTYHASDPDAYCDEEAYLEDVYVIVAGSAYEFQLWLPCGDTLDRERAEFHEVLDSVRFTAGQEQVQAEGAAIVWAVP